MKAKRRKEDPRRKGIDVPEWRCLVTTRGIVDPPGTIRRTDWTRQRWYFQVHWIETHAGEVRRKTLARAQPVFCWRGRNGGVWLSAPLGTAAMLAPAMG
jgi:hypothetical protein